MLINHFIGLNMKHATDDNHIDIIYRERETVTLNTYLRNEEKSTLHPIELPDKLNQKRFDKTWTDIQTPQGQPVACKHHCRPS